MKLHIYVEYNALKKSNSQMYQKEREKKKSKGQ